jgi:hypothetical protein
MIGSRGTLVLALVLGGCGDDDNFSPTIETVAGSYSAATFTVTTAEGTLDLLAQGSHVTLNLATDGTTTGQLFIPGGGEDGEDFDADLTGTWTLNGSTVTFDQAADTFFRDVEFAADRDRLTGEGDFGDESIRLVLTKVAPLP